MFDPRKLMDKEYAKLGLEGDGMDFQKNLKKEPIAMNWADPYRPNDTVPQHVKDAVIETDLGETADIAFVAGFPVVGVPGLWGSGKVGVVGVVF